jgi:hypothetical protein
MSEETVVEQQHEGAAEDVVVSGKPLKDEKKVDPALDFASSSLPYHTKETEQIQADRTKELEGKEPEPYKYEANGYTVEEIDGPNPQTTSEENKNKLYKVTGNDLAETVFNNKTAAEIFVRTHSPEFARMPAGVPKT